MFGLATVRKVAPQIKFDRSKAVADLATLQAIITHRYAVATSYAKSVKTACAAEIAALRARHGHVDLPSLRRIKRWLASDAAALPEQERARLEQTLEKSTVLQQIYHMRQELAALWEPLDRLVASSFSPGCRTGATAPKRRAYRRSRNSRCSSSGTRNTLPVVTVEASAARLDSLRRLLFARSVKRPIDVVGDPA